VSSLQINGFGSSDAKTTRMLPAPHSNFFENTPAPRAGRLGDQGRLAFASDKLESPMASCPKQLFGPVASFLKSRIGARWNQVVAELCDKLGSEAGFHRIVPQVSELVEFNVVEADGGLCHGSGLLKGQPLQAGWRRRLYVCPTTGRLRRIESALAKAC